MIILLIFILGLFVGSFLNVLADRLPREEAVLVGRSHCEFCKKNLQILDLIPLFSFIFLKGKCRYCKNSLSMYYPVVELVTGILFVMVFLQIFNFQFSIFNQTQTLSLKNIITITYYLFITSSLIAIFFADLKYGIIPDKIIYPSIIISLSFLIFNFNFLILNYLLAGLGAFLFFLLLFIITRGRGMGFGDVKLIFLLGLFLGFPHILIALYVSFLTGAVAAIILVIWGKKKFFGGSIPFGPFLVLGTFVALLLGRQIFNIAGMFFIR